MVDGLAFACRHSLGENDTSPLAIRVTTCDFIIRPYERQACFLNQQVNPAALKIFSKTQQTGAKLGRARPFFVLAEADDFIGIRHRLHS